MEKWEEGVGTEEVRGQKRKAGQLLQIHPGTDDTDILSMDSRGRWKWN